MFSSVMNVERGLVHLNATSMVRPIMLFISRHPLFRKGLKRIVDGLLNHNIALMCAEKDPIMCHRTILICKNLRNDVKEIEHILCDEDIEPQDQLKNVFSQWFTLRTRSS